MSSKSLEEIFSELSEWRCSSIHNEANIPWTASHIHAVSDYFTKLRNCGCCYFVRLYMDAGSYQVIAKSIGYFFTHELRELLAVPRLPINLSTLKKSEYVAAFIDFLLQLLYHRTDYMRFYEDQINSLERRLRFLVTVLGDTSFIGIELQQARDLLAQFEASADDAATLLYSFIFLPVPASQYIGIDESLDALLNRIEILEANIITFSNLLPFLNIMTPKTVSVDSLFIVDSLLHDLDELINHRNDGLVLNVKDQIKLLHQQLTLSQSLLKGIKASPHNSETVQDLKAGIRGVAYDAEYLINCYVAGDAPRWYLTIRLIDFIHKIMIARTGLQEIANNHDLAFLQVADDNSSSKMSSQATIPEVDDIMVGFEERATNILDQLVGGRATLQTIFIFGMPGLGKTTFAKKLYNHPLVTHRLDKRSWCVVSQSYERRRLLTDILLGLTGEVEKDSMLSTDEETLVVRIHKCLKGRRYLIVVDDIWDLNAWDDIQRCFPDDQNGSRILFTSRNKDIALPNSLVYPLASLSDDQCWELLETKVFQNEVCPHELLAVGKQIAAKCSGLPLAVVVIAGILSNICKEKGAWTEVRENITSYIFDGGDNSVMQILKLSYMHLAEHLKPCFLYFGAFPEDKEIPVRKLMRLWIAEGFIRKEERNSAESVAEQYLMELIDKSLVIVSKRRSDGGFKACVIHDLLRELCQVISQQENFLKFDRTYITSTCGRRPRSFHSFGRQNYVGNMKLIRVLNVDSPGVHSMIGMQFLMQLRYLTISGLSESIGSLVNLEYLLIVRTYNTAIVPLVITKMMKLRYFRVPGKVIYDDDCDSSQTNNLESFSGITVRNLKDEEMLKCSPNLRRLKCFFERSYLEENGSYPDLRFFTQLNSLNLTIHGDAHIIMAEIFLPSSIKKLALSWSSFPWEHISSIIGARLPNLQVLKLDGPFEGEKWETRDDEFQQLTFLQLQWINLREWDVASRDHFPKLQRLVLRSCFLLEDIPSEIGEISTLQSIEIHGRCQKSLIESARRIEEEQMELGNEELSIIVNGIHDEDSADEYNELADEDSADEDNELADEDSADEDNELADEDSADEDNASAADED